MRLLTHYLVNTHRVLAFHANDIVPIHFVNLFAIILEYLIIKYSCLHLLKMIRKNVVRNSPINIETNGDLIFNKKNYLVGDCDFGSL